MIEVGKKEKEKENTNCLTAIAATTSAAYSPFCTLTGKKDRLRRILNQGKAFPALERAPALIIRVTKVRCFHNTSTDAELHECAVVKYRAKRWSGHASRDKADKLGTLLHLTVPLSGNAISCCLSCLTLHLAPCTLHLAGYHWTRRKAPGRLSLPIEPEPGGKCLRLNLMNGK